jgi:hypothetical protein
MNHEEKYRAWKERPISLNVPPDFSTGVLRRIQREAAERSARWQWPGILELFQRNVSFQYAAVAVAAAAGLSRLWLIFFAILNP